MRIPAPLPPQLALTKTATQANMVFGESLPQTIDLSRRLHHHQVKAASSSGNVLTVSRRTWQEKESSTSDGSDKDVKKNDN
jgi:hypothetical protein